MSPQHLKHMKHMSPSHVARQHINPLPFPHAALYPPDQRPDASGRGRAGDSLLSVLRDDLGLTGSKFGCGEGHCGACTVLIDGQTTRSCVTRGQRRRRASPSRPSKDSRTGPAASRAAGVPRGRSVSVRVLHARHGHGGSRPAASPRPIRPRHDIARVMDRNVCRCGTYPADRPRRSRWPRQRMRRDGRPRVSPAMRPLRLRHRARALRVQRSRNDTGSSCERRDFLRVRLAAGLVVVARCPRLGARRNRGAARQARRRRPTRASRRGCTSTSSGGVTAYTGKVEIGQNIRTSLAQAVADELRLPIEPVTMVMADTDLTPVRRRHVRIADARRGWRRQLARAAATAREMLIDQAAARWQTDRSTLTVRRRPDRRPRSALPRPMASSRAGRSSRAPSRPRLPSHQSIAGRPGQATKKVNGRLFVTGATVHAGLLGREWLYGRIVRPDGMARRWCRSMTAPHAPWQGSRRCATASSSAWSRRASERPSARPPSIRVQWTGARPNQPSSATIYEHLKKTSGRGGGRGAAPFNVGDVARARSEGARTFDASYRIPYIAHVPLEPRAAVAEWAEGKLTVWTGTQRPFGVRSELAERLSDPRGSRPRDRPRHGIGLWRQAHAASTPSKRRGWRTPRASR